MALEPLDGYRKVGFDTVTKKFNWMDGQVDKGVIAGLGGGLFSKLDATIDPGVSNDGTEGYVVGSTWINITADKIFRAVDITTGAAIWKDIGAGAAGGIGNVIEDVTPQLGGQLDVNGHALGDGILELLKFSETISAVNEITISNSATGTSPAITATGDDINVDLNLDAKGTGAVKVPNSNMDIAGNIIVSGTVDGRDIATDGTKLDGVEANATADQTGAEIKTAYELEVNTNAFTDAEQTKLGAIEALADVTDTANVDSAGAVMDTDISAAEGFLRKTGAGAYTAIKTNLSAITDPGATDDSGLGYGIGSRWINITLDKVFEAVDTSVGAAVWKDLSAAGGGGGDMLAATYDPGTVAGDAFDMDNMVEGAATKILTDVERTNISTNNAKITNATHTGDATGDTALTIANNAVSLAKMADMATASLLGRNTAATGDPEVLSKATALTLLNVEDGATADQTGAEIKTAYENNANTNAFTDAEKTNLGALPVEIGLAASDETTDLTTGTAKVTFRMPFAMTLTGVRANVNTAPTGSVLTVDINETGATILSTKITIDATEKTSQTAATAPIISDTALADDAEITVDIDTIGSTVAGAGLKIWLIGTRV